MSVIEATSDVDNTFLSRREITCNFSGLSGRLARLDAVDMVAKEFELGSKLVIPMRLKNHVGRPVVTGTFYVYDDEDLARSHVNPTIFKRLDKSRKAREEAAKPDEPETEQDGTAAEAKPDDAGDKPDEASKGSE